MTKGQVLNLFRKPFTGEFLGNKLSDLLDKNRESFWLRKLVPGNNLYPKGTERLCRRYGVNFSLDLSDYQQWLLYFSDNHDSSLGVLSYVESGFTVIDVGGNVGQTALAMAKKVGDSGKVISFEPYPATVKRFKKNLELNQDIKNIRLENYALGDFDGSISLFQDCVTNSGGNRVLYSDTENHVGVERVPATTLDSYLAKEKSITGVDLIKIDVEGFEMSVLRGAEQTLLKYKPKLVVEVDDKNLTKQGATTDDLVTFLRRLDYSLIDLSTMKEFSSGGASIHTDIFCSVEN